MTPDLSCAASWLCMLQKYVYVYVCMYVSTCVCQGRMVMAQVGEASMESEQERRHGMTGTEWKVATALFTVGEVTASLTLLRPQHDSALLSDTSNYLLLAQHPPPTVHTCADRHRHSW